MDNNSTDEVVLKKDPNTDALLGFYESPGIVPLNEFAKGLIPGIYGPDGKDSPDMMDQWMSRYGILTPKIQRLRQALVQEQQLTPAYEAYVQAKGAQAQQRAFAPTQREALQYGTPLSPYPGSQLPARTMQVDQNLVPDTFDIDELQPSRPQDRFNYDRRAELADSGRIQRTLDFPEQPNLDAPLRPTQAAYLAATMQGTGRGRQPQQIPAGLQEFTQLVEAETAAQTTEKGRPLTPREHADIVAFATKQFSPGARPGTPEGLVAKVAGAGAQKKFDAEVAAILARARQDNADAISINKQLEGRIEETTARIALAKTQAGTVGQKAAIADEMANLAQAKSALMTLKYLGAKGDLSTESENILTKTILELLSPNLTATPKEPALLPSLFGATQGSGVDITKNPNAVPRPTPRTSVVPPPINLTNPAEENLKLLKKLQDEYPGYDVTILPDGTQLKKKKT